METEILKAHFSRVNETAKPFKDSIGYPSNLPNPLNPLNPLNPPNPPSPPSPSHTLNPCPHPPNPRFKDSPPMLWFERETNFFNINE